MLQATVATNCKSCEFTWNAGLEEKGIFCSCADGRASRANYLKDQHEAALESAKTAIKRNVCTRCGGSGFYHTYGECFRCEGSGTDPRKKGGK